MTGSHVVQAVLERSCEVEVTWNLGFFCLCLSGAGIIGMHHLPWLM